MKYFSFAWLVLQLFVWNEHNGSTRAVVADTTGSTDARTSASTTTTTTTTTTTATSSSNNNNNNDDDDDAATCDDSNTMTTNQTDDSSTNTGSVERESLDDKEDVSSETNQDKDTEEDHSEEEHSDDLFFKVWETTDYTLDEFRVAGVNLADFGKQPLFPLFEDFDISSYIRGDEDWHDLLAYRNALTRPTLSFYVDKVARKRWLPTMGFPQPKVHFLSYAVELTKTGTVEDETNAILEALPTTGSFCAKPTHMSLTQGAWLVDHPDEKDEKGTTHFSTGGLALEEHEGQYDARVVANHLAETLHEKADDIESWALKNVQPGLVVEERWVDHNVRESPPHEFNMFVIWGKLWVGQWNTVDKHNRYCDGFIYRNGTLAKGGFYPPDYVLPEWVPWDELVEIAEKLGRNKDMFRVDIFVGRPASADASAPLQIGISESEIFPTTVFTSDELSREGARLWLAGYALGIYEIVENTEVPREFRYRGRLSDISRYRKTTYS